jgi:hypothetical protein
MESFNSRFQIAIESGAMTPIWLIKIWDGTGGIHRWVSGGVPRFGYDASIDRVTKIGCSMDPLTRKVSVSGVSIVFLDDGSLRSYVSSTTARNKRIELFLGDADMAEVDYVMRFGGYITEVTPAEGAITIAAQDGRGLIRSATTSVGFLGTPYDLLKQFMLLANGDVSTVSVPSGREHWMTALAVEDAITWNPLIANKIPVGETVLYSLDDLVFLLGGVFFYRASTGVGRWKHYDRSAASIRTLTSDDIIAIEQETDQGYLYNRFTTALDIQYPYYSAASKDISDSSYWQVESSDGINTGLVYRIDDVASQSALASGDGVIGSQIVEYTFSSKLIRAVTLMEGKYAGETNYSPNWLVASITSASNEKKVVNQAKSAGFCGSAFSTGSTPGSTPILTAPLSSANKGYFVLVSNNNDVVSSGVASKVEGAESDLSEVITQRIRAINDYGTTDFIYGPAISAYRLSGRGLFGTTAQSHGQGIISDITILRDCANRNLARFSRGVMVLVARVHLRHMDLELGDIISLVDDVPIARSMSGVSASDKFEIVAVEEDIDSDTPSVTLRLAWLDGPSTIAPTTTETLIKREAKTLSSASLVGVSPYGNRYFRGGGEVT